MAVVFNGTNSSVISGRIYLPKPFNDGTVNDFYWQANTMMP